MPQAPLVPDQMAHPRRAMTGAKSVHPIGPPGRAVPIVILAHMEQIPLAEVRGDTPAFGSTPKHSPVSGPPSIT